MRGDLGRCHGRGGAVGRPFRRVMAPLARLAALLGAPIASATPLAGGDLSTVLRIRLERGGTLIATYRKSAVKGTSVSVRVHLRGVGIIKQKTRQNIK